MWGQFSRLDRPGELIRHRFWRRSTPQLGFFRALVFSSICSHLIGERSAPAAGQLEHIGHGGALAVQQIDLLSDSAGPALRRVMPAFTSANSFCIPAWR